MRSSPSSSLLLMLSIEFFISVMSFFISSWFLFISSWFSTSSWFLHILLNLSSILFIHLMAISLNSFSDRLLASIASILFTSFSDDACFSFICELVLCFTMISLLQVFGYVILSLLCLFKGTKYNTTRHNVQGTEQNAFTILITPNKGDHPSKEN
uniref:Uncharacterized protein n=1 Tax=Myotis myotis TaxID=51298 RepID=A0A7J7YE93_MYOMY|nr:hypothetical protein mMyoMyo1_011157 [Myotis myotis]